jgi:hypothetical protein
MSNRISNRITYWLERMLLRGMRYRLLLVAMVIGSVSLVAGAIVWLLDPSIGNPAYAIWWAFLRITDTGYLGDDTGARRGVSTVLTVGGAVIFLGGLIAIMVQGLNQGLARLEAGLTPMVARNHIAILGWTNRTPQLVSELVHSEGRVRRFLKRRGARRLRIVILAEQVTRELHHSLRERLGDAWSERLVTFRSGSPLKWEHLRRVDVEHAAAVVIPGCDFAPAGPERTDANTVKTLLSISRHGRDDALALPLAVAEISDPRRTSLAYDAYRGPLEVIAGDAIMASILAQCIRHPGLASVFSQVLTHDHGNEVHVRQFPQLVGRRLRGLDEVFPRAIVLGTVRAGGADLRLDPPDDYVVDEEDRIVFLAPSHEACEPLRDLPEEPPPFGVESAPPPPAMPPRRRVLVLGWSPRVSALAAELGRYDTEGFDIDVASVTPAAERETHLRHFEVPSGRVNVKQLEVDYTVPSELRKVGPGRYDNVVLVSSQWTGAEEEADARTILAYLLLREILPESGPTPAILAEVMDAENLDLFARSSCETVQPTVILSHMLAQVVLRRELGAVYQELFGPGGAEIIYRKAKEYDLLGCPIRFAELQAAAARHGEIALGLHFGASATLESGALLNPPRDETFVLASDDELIVLTSYSSLPCI